MNGHGTVNKETELEIVPCAVCLSYRIYSLCEYFPLTNIGYKMERMACCNEKCL